MTSSKGYHEEKRVAWYTNCNGVCAVIVARLDYFCDVLFEWRAFIGGSTKTEREADAIEDVLRNTGCDLGERLAAAIFPDLPMNKYRM